MNFTFSSIGNVFCLQIKDLDLNPIPQFQILLYPLKKGKKNRNFFIYSPIFSPAKQEANNYETFFLGNTNNSNKFYQTSSVQYTFQTPNRHKTLLSKNSTFLSFPTFSQQPNTHIKPKQSKTEGYSLPRFSQQPSQTERKKNSIDC